MSGSSNQEDFNETNELAKERNRAAADRTLLAWIRTSLALIGFGFGIDRIVNAVAAGRESTGLTVLVGSSFMALGIYGIISASINYRAQLLQLRGGRYIYRSRPSQTLILAIVLAVIGAVALVGIVVQAYATTVRR